MPTSNVSPEFLTKIIDYIKSAMFLWNKTSQVFFFKREHVNQDQRLKKMASLQWLFIDDSSIKRGQENNYCSGHEHSTCLLILLVIWGTGPIWMAVCYWCIIWYFTHIKTGWAKRKKWKIDHWYCYFKQKYSYFINNFSVIVNVRHLNDKWQINESFITMVISLISVWNSRIKVTTIALNQTFYEAF